MAREFIGLVNKQVAWEEDIEPGFCYMLRYGSAIVITSVRIYVHKDGTVEPFIQYRILGDDGPTNHVSVSAQWVIDKIARRLV